MTRRQRRPNIAHNCSHSGSVIVIVAGGLEHGGGIGRQTGYFLRAVKARRSDISYRVMDPRGQRSLATCRPYIAIASLHFASAALSLVLSGIGNEPTIAHLNIAGRGSTIRKVALAKLARICRIPYLLHVHDPDYVVEYLRRSRLMRWTIRGAFGAADRVLVLGTRDQELLSELLKISRDTIMVLPNAVPDPCPTMPRPQGKREVLNLLFLGELSTRKGVPLLLEALAGEPLVSRNWQATLAGGGAVKKYRRLAESLGIADRVEFPGWLDQSKISALLGNADVLVQPSHAEGLVCWRIKLCATDSAGAHGSSFLRGLR